MFCKECGHEMPDGVMFCPECGAKQDGNAAQTNASGTQAAGAVPVGQVPQPQGEAPKKQIQIDKKWMAPIAVVAGVVVVAGIVSMTMKPTIKLDKYMEVSAEGYNTVGKATLSFDTEKFEKDYEKKLEKALKKGKNKKNKNAYQASAYLSDYFGDYDPTSEAANLLSNAVSGELDKTSSLSNGDVITYQWSCDDDYVLNKYGFKLKYSDIQYTVSGLEEAETFDPFEGLEVTFEGIETEGRATLNGQPTAREAQDLNYDFDKSSDLSNGDTVTVSVSTYNGDVIDYCIDKYDKIPSPMEKNFTVAGLQHYASGAGDISDEARKSMENRGQEILAGVDVSQFQLGENGMFPDEAYENDINRAATEAYAEVLSTQPEFQKTADINFIYVYKLDVNQDGVLELLVELEGEDSKGLGLEPYFLSYDGNVNIQKIPGDYASLDLILSPGLLPAEKKLILFDGGDGIRVQRFSMEDGELQLEKKSKVGFDYEGEEPSMQTDKETEEEIKILVEVDAIRNEEIKEPDALLYPSKKSEYPILMEIDQMENTGN